jgi:hypothetical protein
LSDLGSHGFYLSQEEWDRGSGAHPLLAYTAQSSEAYSQLGDKQGLKKSDQARDVARCRWPLSQTSLPAWRSSTARCTSGTATTRCGATRTCGRHVRNRWRGGVARWRRLSESRSWPATPPGSLAEMVPTGGAAVTPSAALSALVCDGGCEALCESRFCESRLGALRVTIL